MKKMFKLLVMVFLMTGLNTLLPAQMAEKVDLKSDVFSTNQVHSLQVKFNQKDWPYLLDSLRVQGDGYLLGNIEIDGKLYENVGIRYRGSKSFKTGSKRNAFNIKLNYIDKNQNHQGYKKLKLSNALRDPSMIREVLGYEIARQYMAAPLASHTKLNINGEYFGLFVAIEAIDDEFLDKHFGSNDGSFFKAASELPEKMPENCKNKIYGALEYEKNPACYMANYEIDSKAGWDDLIELTDMLNNKPDQIETVLNVDQTLWMLAFNNVLVNLNSYTGQHSQNFYLYKDKMGRFNPIIWDLNLVLGSYKNTGKGSDLNLKELQMMDPLLHADNPTKPLIHQLLKNSEYKKMYLDHIRTIVYDHFVSGKYLDRAKELQGLINTAFYSDPNKFYTMADFTTSLDKTIGKRSKIPGIEELMSKRARFLKKHPEVAIFPPEIEEVELTKRAEFSTEKVKTFQIQAKVKNRANRVKLFYRTKADQPYQSTYMADDGKHNDGEAGDKIFGVTIDPKGAYDQIDYYFQTENAKAIGFYPNDYMYNPKTTSLSQLN